MAIVSKLVMSQKGAVITVRTEIKVIMGGFDQFGMWVLKFILYVKKYYFFTEVVLFYIMNFDPIPSCAGLRCAPPNPLYARGTTLSTLLCHLLAPQAVSMRLEYLSV